MVRDQYSDSPSFSLQTTFFRLVTFLDIIPTGKVKIFFGNIYSLKVVTNEKEEAVGDVLTIIC